MATAKTTEARQSLTGMLSKVPTFKGFTVWLVGDTPLIVHAWSEKARREMLAKQTKATKGGKEIRDPEADFQSSLYEMDGGYGFPAMGIKNAILSVAHKDKGVARSAVMGALWIDADMVRARPALAGAICDMPLIRIFGTAPECREDMTKIGSGLNTISFGVGHTGVDNVTFNAANGEKATIMSDISRFTGPRRNRAQTRNHR